MAKSKKAKKITENIDWKKIAELILQSRAMDEKEENELVHGRCF